MQYPKKLLLGFSLLCLASGGLACSVTGDDEFAGANESLSADPSALPTNNSTANDPETDPSPSVDDDYASTDEEAAPELPEPKQKTLPDPEEDDSSDDALPDLSDLTQVTLVTFGEVIAWYKCHTMPACLGHLAPVFLMGSGGDTETCKAQFHKRYQNADLPGLQLAVDSGRMVYRKDLLQSCLDSVLSCSSLDPKNSRQCERVLEGTVPLGGDCLINEECAGEAHCAGCGQRTCVPGLLQGEKCEDDTQCHSDLTCFLNEEDATVGTCESRIQDGAKCTAWNECTWPYVCAVIDSGGMRCQHVTSLESASVGESCDLNGMALCDEGLFCAAKGASLSCEKLVASGGSCHMGLPDPCPVGEFCSLDLLGGQTTGKCEARGKAGASCASFNPLACASGYECVPQSLNCIKLLDNGAGCFHSTQCWSELCSDGICSESSPKCSL